MELLGTNKRDIHRAASIIKSGEIIVYPTDTLYGLGADALNKDAIRAVFKIKKRPLSLPLPIAVSNIEMLKEYVKLDTRSKSVIEKFLPGALTVILKKKGNLPDILTSGSEKVAVRIPDKRTALDLINVIGYPITTTSANLSGKIPPISVEEVQDQLKDVKFILDGGKLASREPSTIIDLTSKPNIVRVGRIPYEVINKALEEIYE